MTSAEETKAFVLEAFDTLFNRRDYAKAAEFWSESYIQHTMRSSTSRQQAFAEQFRVVRQSWRRLWRRCNPLIGRCRP